MVYYFGDCILDEERYELQRAGTAVAIEPKVFQVLVYLIQHRDRMVTRDELLAYCWPGTFVSDSALTQCLARIRKAVGEQRGGPHMVKTVHGQGYRFVAPLLPTPSSAAPPTGASQYQAHTATCPPARLPQGDTPLAEHRSLTVLCAECVDVARLADHGDPEALHTVMQAFHTTCTEVIHGFEGSIAHYLSDGLVAYFGYPQAHEDDVQRGIRAGLRLVQVLQQQPAAVAQGPGTVRIGIHTGPVVVGESGDGRAPLAVGETLRLAARLKDLAAPGTVVVSAITARLVEGYFLWQEKARPPPPGGMPSLGVYEVLGESAARSRLEVVAQRRGLTPFVGREAEVAVLHERWAQVKEGLGQVVLLHGEAGIGKSRLVQWFTEQIASEPHTRFECHGSPYHQHSAWYPVTDLLTRTYANRTEYREAGELGEQLLALAQRMEHEPSLVIAHNALGTTLIFLGEFTRARAHLEQGITLSLPPPPHAQPVSVPIVSRVTNYAYVAGVLWILGYPDQALHRSREALALAQELKHPFSRAMALTWAAVLHQLRREAQAAQQYAAVGLTLATEQGFATYTAASTILSGWGLVQRGRSAEGVRQISQGLEAWQAAGSVNFHYWSALLAEAHGHNGQVGAGLAQLTKALATVDRSGEGLWEAELHRLKGVLLLMQPDPDARQTETCLHHALAIARRQRAKSLELRAAMSLARLWQCQGKRAAARELLTPVYGWFTEGFDTADLQDAKVLLDALA